MKHLAHLLTPGECLLRVYSPQIARNNPTTLLRTRVLYRDLQIPARASIVSKDLLSDFTKDEQIDTRLVNLKQSDGKLSEAQPIRDILRSIDRANQVVIQLSKPGEREEAVVEIRERSDLLRQIREREQQVKEQSKAQKDQKPKQIEMNWAIASNDLEIKLKQLGQFLIKGKKVEILLAAKKRQRRATEEEAEDVLKKVREKVSEVGARELKMEGAVSKQAILTAKKMND